MTTLPVPTNDRGQPLWAGSLVDALIDSVELLPIQKSCEFCNSSEKYKMDFRFFGNAIERSGVPVERLRDTVSEYRMPRLRIEFDEKSAQELMRFSIYGAEPTLSAYHELRVVDGQIFLHLHRILARERHVATFTQQQLDRLEARVADLIAERDKAFAPRFEREQRALRMKMAVKDCGNSLEKQLSLLEVRGQNIVLPPMEFKLSQYAEIKKRLEKAGGNYSVNKELGSYFAFAQGIDASQVLQTLQQGGSINVKKETQFFATPKKRAVRAVAALGDISGKRVIEPSAGDGALADEARLAGAEVETIENWAVNVLALKKKGYDPIERDFLTVTPDDTGLFHAVVMNPPFTKGQDAQHIRHALSFLHADGVMSAIMSRAYEGQDKGQYKGFSDILKIGDAAIESIDAGEFKESGTNVATAMMYMSMERLLQGLQERGETGKEYGLDLSRQWAEMEDREVIVSRFAEVQRA